MPSTLASNRPARAVPCPRYRGLPLLPQTGPAAFPEPATESAHAARADGFGTGPSLMAPAITVPLAQGNQGHGMRPSLVTLPCLSVGTQEAKVPLASGRRYRRDLTLPAAMQVTVTAEISRCRSPSTSARYTRDPVPVRQGPHRRHDVGMDHASLGWSSAAISPACPT